jgi:hypothetical protein
MESPSSSGLNNRRIETRLPLLQSRQLQWSIDVKKSDLQEVWVFHERGERICAVLSASEL